MTAPLATHAYTPGALEAVLQFLKRGDWELRQLRCVRVWKDHFHVIDVNHDCFAILGLGYADADVIPALQMVNAAFNPQTIHEPTEADHKEFGTGRCHPWAQDRVM